MVTSSTGLLAKYSRRAVALLLGGLLPAFILALSPLGGTPAAHAFGMFGFGHGGGFGGGFAGPGPGYWRRLPPRTGPGRIVGGPGWRQGPGFGYGGRAPRHPPLGVGVGTGVIGGGVVGGGGGGGNNGGGGGGGGAAPSATFVPNEVITAFAPGTTPAAIDQLARRYDLTQVDTQNLPLIGTSIYRWRIGGARSVANAIRALGTENAVASVQPNYIFALQDEAANAVVGGPGTVFAAGDPAQYVLAKLQCAPAQKIATGKDVVVAVIDSAIDPNHPDLGGSIVKTFDALGDDNAPAQKNTAQKNAPQSHGTAMAGAIAAHAKLLGIAPGAQLLAVRAFDDTPGTANGTSFAIDKALQWAADNGARIVNMSFAGPADPLLGRMLAAAFDKGIVLIAAAGNGGPQAAPPYPAADANVIAVTATDGDDHLFKLANRGRYVAVAAPGVDILALAPGDAYALSTGTSIAAAHVSGIAALLLEHKPALKPADIRNILISTAQRLGPPRPDSEFGAGLVSAYRAVSWLDHGAPVAGGGDGAAQAKQ